MAKSKANNSKTNNSNLKNAIVDIAKSLESVFKKYTSKQEKKHGTK